MEYLINLAADLLIENGIGALPVDAHNLSSKKAKWHIGDYLKWHDYIEKLGLLDYSNTKKGFTVQLPGNEYFIFYSHLLAYGEQNEVIAHEICHVIARHSSVGKVMGKSDDFDMESRQEKEADVFVRYLLGPACVLSKSKLNSVSEISKATSLSRRYSLEVREDIKNLHGTPTDNMLCHQFRDYIKSQSKYKYKKYATAAAVYGILAALLILAAFAAGYYVREWAGRYERQQEYIQKKIEQEQKEVFVTPSGNKFHREDCRTVRNSELRKMSVKDAIESGYGACGVCRPMDD